MIKDLQKKFIVTAMIAISLLMIVLICALNITNYVIQDNRSDDLLSMLAESGGEPEFRGERPRPEEHGGFLAQPIDKDEAMSQRYFFVKCAEDGTVIESNLLHISAVDEAEALELTRQVLETDLQSGRISSFKYVKAIGLGPDGTVNSIFFLDISQQNQAVLTVLMLSALIGVLCWLLMLLVVIALSKNAIAPIAANMEKQKQFVTNAGHEIKTPLAIILSNVEAMELYNGENKWSKNIKAQTLRLNKLMQNLLTLSRMDEINQYMPMTDFSMKELLEDTLASFGAAIEEKQIQLVKSLEEVSTYGNRETLGNLLSIVVDNAIKYSPEEGEIKIKLSRYGRSTTITVENISQEPMEENPEKLFDRFYRGDAARTQKKGGYGIGLSAARAICELHKGSITAKTAYGNRIIFTIKL